MSLSEADLLRFTSKIEYTDSCWLWVGACHKNGYGQFKVDGKVAQANRVALENHLGRKLLPGMVAAHAPHDVCGHRNCVNPEHLREASYTENATDRNVDKTMICGEQNHSSKLTASQVLAIRSDTRMKKLIAAEYGVSDVTISSICLKKTWKHLTDQ